MTNQQVSETIFKAINLIRIDIMSNKSNKYYRKEIKNKCWNFFTNEFVRLLTEQTEHFQEVYDFLADDLSRETYLADIKNRVLRLYYSGFLTDEMTNVQIYSAEQHRRDIIKFKTNHKVSHWSNFIANDVMIAIKDQYTIPGLFEVTPGDVVFDIGSYNGANAISFAGQTGPSGQVYSFEPILTLFEDSRNNTASYSNITCVQLALSNFTGTCLFSSLGTVSSASDQGDQRVDVDTLDNFVETRGIKVDFIKMDIEGGELTALYGATKSIGYFRPKLAICIYHNNGEDLLTVPLFLNNLNMNYLFYIRKYHISWQESVILALPR
ncbi:MAG: FkbM family methyltransferase [Deltaproteobacteria bacterium]|jgi:FkbM family methyltransferase|nr:FkbM family methyltransferase [Deltaproteobacteria bacterium]